MKQETRMYRSDFSENPWRFSISHRYFRFAEKTKQCDSNKKRATACIERIFPAVEKFVANTRFVYNRSEKKEKSRKKKEESRAKGFAERDVHFRLNEI